MTTRQLRAKNPIKEFENGLKDMNKAVLKFGSVPEYQRKCRDLLDEGVRLKQINERRQYGLPLESPANDPQ